MKKHRTGLHKTALAALFTVGNSLIRYPWRNVDPDMLILFLLSVVGALIPAFLLYPLFRKILRRRLSGHGLRMAAAVVLALLLGAYALFCVYRSCEDYLNFAMELILPGSNRILLALVFLVCAVWLSRVPEKGMDSFSLVCFVCVLVSVITLFCFGIPHFRTEYFKVRLPEGISELTGSLPVLLRESLFPLTVLSGYFALVVPRKGERALAGGTAIGCGILLLCVLQTLLTFGASYAAELQYPYSFAVRIISVGQYFFRLEGFSYLLDYTACMVRAAVCFAVARRLLGRFSHRLARFLPPVAALAMFGIFCFG